MSPLNDDELNSLLEQAKRESPEPSPELAARTLRAYKDAFGGRISLLQYFLRPVSIPWPLGVLGAILFLLIGALADHSLHRPATADVNGTPQTVSSKPVAVLTFKDFQPVNELRPRVIRRLQDDQ